MRRTGTDGPAEHGGHADQNSRHAWVMVRLQQPNSKTPMNGLPVLPVDAMADALSSQPRAAWPGRWMNSTTVRTAPGGSAPSNALLCGGRSARCWGSVSAGGA
jgi:hypothetical protein